MSVEIRHRHAFGGIVYEREFLQQIGEFPQFASRNRFEDSILDSGPFQEHLAQFLERIADMLRVAG